MIQIWSWKRLKFIKQFGSLTSPLVKAVGLDQLTLILSLPSEGISLRSDHQLRTFKHTTRRWGTSIIPAPHFSRDYTDVNSRTGNSTRSQRITALVSHVTSQDFSCKPQRHCKSEGCNSTLRVQLLIAYLLRRTWIKKAELLILIMALKDWRYRYSWHL